MGSTQAAMLNDFGFARPDDRLGQRIGLWSE